MPGNLIALSGLFGGGLGCIGVFQRSEFERGAAQSNGLAGLHADFSGDLAVVDKCAVTATDILNGAAFRGHGELGVFAGNVGASKVDGAGGITADGIIARNQVKSSQSLAAAACGQLNDWRRHGNLLAASCPPRGRKNLAGKQWNVERERDGFGIDLKLNLGMLRIPI